MRKNYTFLFIIPIFILGLLVSCAEDFSEFRVADSFVNYEEDLTMQTIYADDFSAADFAFTATSSWETQSDEDWISTYPESGESGASSIQINTSGNYTGIARRGTLYIVSGLYKIAVIIDQSELSKGGIVPDDPDYKLSIEEGSTSMSIYANELQFDDLVFYAPDSWTRELTYEGDASDWLTITGAEKGSEGSYTLSIKATAVNFTGNEKVATLRLSVDENSAVPTVAEDMIITLIQTDKDENGDEVQLEFAYDDASDRAVDASETVLQSFVFTADAEWTAETTGQDWLTVSPTSGVAGQYTMTFTAAAVNTTGADKTGSVKLTYNNDPAEDPSEVNIALTQRSTVNGGAFNFNFTNATDALAAFNYDVESKTITFDAPSAWVATTDASWFTISPASGASGTNTITITSTLNTVQEARSDVLSLKSASADYDGNYATLDYDVDQLLNPDGELPIKYTTSLANFSTVDAYAAYTEGKYVIEITDSGVVTDTDLQALENYLKGGTDAPDNGSIILSMPNITRILTTSDSDATGAETDGYVFNGSNAIRELWLPKLTDRPYKMWNVYYLEVLYMPKAGGALTYVLFKNSGNKTTAGGMSVIAWGTDAAAGEITLVSSTTKAFMTTGDLSGCTFYTNESNYSNFLTALGASNITYGELVVGEYDPEGTAEE